MDTRALRIAAVAAFLYRIGFAGILFTAVADLQTATIQYVLLAIASIMTAVGFYRLYKMLALATKMDTLQKRVDNVN